MDDKKYFIREDIKGKKKTTVYAIKDWDKEGITVQTVIESLDGEGESKVTEKYYPNNGITQSKIDGEVVYELTGGF